MVVVMLCLVSLLVLFLLCAFLFLAFGWFKFLYHDALGWHEPAKDAEQLYNGCNTHSICKHCGKEIMQDSQGNWFEV